MSRPITAIDLAGGWSAWSFVEVRSAGFAVDRLDPLRAPRVIAALDQLLDLEEAIDAAWIRAREAIDRCPPGDAVRRARNRLRKRKLPANPAALGGAREAVERLVALEARHAELYAQLEKSYTADALATSRALFELARARDFREAVTWQNRSAVTGGLDVVARRAPEADDAQTRRKRRLVVRYLSRYAVKNETIGFFGPFAWAHLGEQTRLVHGDALVRERRLYFEHWGIAALAETIAADPEVKAALPPRLHPMLRLEGGALVLASGASKPLPPAIAGLLGRCDGETAARELGDRDDALEILEELEQAQMIVWGFDLPPTEPRPERRLRRQLEAIGASAGLEMLDALEAAGDVAGAAGDPDALARELDAVGARFSRLTGRAATRRAGQSYSGRTLMVEDCQRDIDIELSASLVSRIAAPLSLIAASARWFTHEIAARITTIAGEIIDGLGGRAGYPRFYRELEPHIPMDPPAGRDLVSEVSDELQARWEAILEFDAAASRVERDPEPLAARVASRFAAPHPGWPFARYHSPDLMIASPGIEALIAGQARFVLGEIHTGMNQMTSRLTLRECPDPDRLIERQMAELPRPRVEPVVPEASSSRVNQGTVYPPQYEIELGATRSSRPADQILRVADLVVERRGERLVVSGDKIDRRFDLIEILEHQLLVASMGRFRPIGNRGHRPRVTVGELVIAREQWKLAVADLDFIKAPPGPQTLAAAHRLARRLGMPRRTFVKVPEEDKPVFFDLDSPIIVDDVARLLARSSSATFTEMLPDLDQTWVPHPDGGRCTSEIRIVLVDPVPWPVPVEL